MRWPPNLPLGGHARAADIDFVIAGLDPAIHEAMQQAQTHVRLI
jgi:hypothetical protein